MIADVEEAVKDKKAEEKFTPIDIDENDIEDNVVSEMKVSEEGLKDIALEISKSGLTIPEYIKTGVSEELGAIILADNKTIQDEIDRLKSKPAPKPKSKYKPSSVPQGQSFSFVNEDGVTTQFTMSSKGIWQYASNQRFPDFTREKDTEFTDWMYNKSLQTFRQLKGSEKQFKEEFNAEKELLKTAEKLEEECL